MSQLIRIVMVAPPLRDQQQAGADQRGEVVRDVDLAARIRQAGGHAADDAALLDDLPQEHRTGIAGEHVNATFDAQRAVETHRDLKSRLTHACVQCCRLFLSSSLNLRRVQAHATNPFRFR